MPKTQLEQAQLVAFGAKVRRQRHVGGLTQERLAEKADLSLRNIQRIEAGELDILLTTVIRIGKALKSSPDDLLEF